MTTHGESEVPAHRWELLAAQRDRLRKLVISRLGHSADVEDCVHEALLRAATFARLDESRLGPFLTAVTLRVCVDHHRAAQRQQRALTRYVDPPEESVEGDVCERDAGSWLLRMTGNLTPRERAVILARAEGLGTADTARALNISHKSAESALTRARNRLRTAYDNEMTRAHRDLSPTISR